MRPPLWKMAWDSLMKSNTASHMTQITRVFTHEKWELLFTQNLNMNVCTDLISNFLKLETSIYTTNKPWHIYAMQHPTAMRRTTLLMPATVWIISNAWCSWKKQRLHLGWLQLCGILEKGKNIGNEGDVLYTLPVMALRYKKQDETQWVNSERSHHKGKQIFFFPISSILYLHEMVDVH